MSAQEAEVVGSKCNKEGILVLKLTDPSGPTYHYNPPSHNSFGDQPLLGIFTMMSNPPKMDPIVYFSGLSMQGFVNER